MSILRLFEKDQPSDKARMTLTNEKRFYYIRVRDIRNIHPDLIGGKDQSNGKFQLTFSFALKKSQSYF